MLARSVALVSAAVALAADPKSSHARYSFAASVPPSLGISSTLVWTAIDPRVPANRGVFLATQFHFEHGNGGYFGGQFHPDGSQTVIFSIWDANATAKTSHPDAPTCGRFGGEGEGSHCEVGLNFSLGTAYDFSVSRVSQNASGSAWVGEVLWKVGKVYYRLAIGRLFLRDAAGAPPGSGYGMLQPWALSFQEYYLGVAVQFHSAAGWIGPTLWSRPGEPPLEAVGDCAAKEAVTACIPGVGCGRPNVFFEHGAAVRQNCSGGNMWA